MPTTVGWLAKRIVYKTKSLPSHHLALSSIYIITNIANETFQMLQCDPFHGCATVMHWKRSVDLHLSTDLESIKFY